jgi:hypothetical protein
MPSGRQGAQSGAAHETAGPLGQALRQNEQVQDLLRRAAADLSSLTALLPRESLESSSSAANVQTDRSRHEGRRQIVWEAVGGHLQGQDGARDLFCHTVVLRSMQRCRYGGYGVRSMRAF